MQVRITLSIGVKLGAIVCKLISKMAHSQKRTRQNMASVLSRGLKWLG